MSDPSAPPNSPHFVSSGKFSVFSDPSPHSESSPPTIGNSTIRQYDNHRPEFSTQTSKSRFPFNPLLLLLVVISLSLASYFALTTFQLRSQLNRYQSQKPSTSAPINSSLKEYSNSEFLFSLSYPKEALININRIPDSKETELIFFRGDENEFTLTATKDYTKSDLGYFLDTPSTGQRSVAGKVWSSFFLPANNTSPSASTSVSSGSDEFPLPLFALRLEQNGILYTLTFPSQTDTSPIQDSILSSLKFQDPKLEVEVIDQSLPKFVPELDTSSWKKYTNQKYKYQLNYPPDWTIEEKSEATPSWLQGKDEYAWIQFVVFSSPDGTYQLHFGLKNTNEKNILLSGRTGVQGGSFVTTATLAFGKDVININSLIYEGKTKEVFYSKSEGGSMFNYDNYQVNAEFSYFKDLSTKNSFESFDMASAPELSIANQILSTIKFVD